MSGRKVKAVAAVLLALGAIAAGGRFSTAEPEKKAADPAKKPSKFPIPVWHPDARWKAVPDPFIGSGARGFLGGKASETMWYGDGLSEDRCSYGATVGPYGCTSYDPATERFLLVAGASRGYLDGPFSRARFGGGDYSHRSRQASSTDGRYVFITEPYFNQALRRLDMVKQEVKTIPLQVKSGIGGMAGDSQGRLLVLLGGTDKLVFVNVEGKQEKELKLDMQEKVGDAVFPCSLTIDEVNNRLYASGYRTKKWYVWFWDLKDGSFHGVLPIAQPGEPKRKRNECGPFKGTDLYGEMGTYFGPDDPKKRFLYVAPNDTDIFFRLDLDKQEIWGSSKDKDGIRFIGSGVPPNTAGHPRMSPEGDIVAWVPFWDGPKLLRFPRVK